MLAIIDIGSNSVRLMLWTDGKSLFKKIFTTRLGSGLANGPLLSIEAIERTAEAVRIFSEEGRARGASVHAFATAAVRRAENGSVFCERVKALCGLDVDVVSGIEEATLGLAGALAGADGGMIDIGGASTEIAVQRDGKEIFSVSLDIGAVRLHDACGDSRECYEKQIGTTLLSLKGVPKESKFYAVGGTASTLASLKLGLSEYDASAIQNLPLSLQSIKELTDKLFSLSTAERKGLAGMDIARADILPGGALLLQKIMEKLGLDCIFASDRDNLEGYVALRGLR